MSEPLLSIRNHHAPACGDPPIVNSDDPHVYIGYFENEHGEQWIFTCCRAILDMVATAESSFSSCWRGHAAHVHGSCLETGATAITACSANPAAPASCFWWPRLYRTPPGQTTRRPTPACPSVPRAWDCRRLPGNPHSPRPHRNLPVDRHLHLPSTQGSGLSDHGKGGPRTTPRVPSCRRSHTRT